MKTTFRGEQPADYLGADLTDRHSKGRRAIDVCGLTCAEGNRLRAAFWHWEWSSPQATLDVSLIAPDNGQPTPCSHCGGTEWRTVERTARPRVSEVCRMPLPVVPPPDSS